jgi:hypothetical protein
MQVVEVPGHLFEQCPWSYLTDLSWLLLSRHRDHERLHISPPSWEEFPAILSQAFRTIDAALSEVRRKDAKRAQSRAAAERKAKDMRKPSSAPTSRPSLAKARAMAHRGRR